MLYGFDIGGTKIAFAVYEQSLRCLFTTEIATPDSYPDFIAAISQLVREADQTFSCIGQIGIGFPGAINRKAKRINCANVPAIKGRTLESDLSALLQREIKLENDANCFLLSECFAGAADHCQSALGVTLGTGVGGALFVNGAIVQGHNHFAGEIGHYPLPATAFLNYPDLPKFSCACGRAICLENYISGTGLRNLYQYYAQQLLSGQEIIEKYQAGDASAVKVMDIYLDLLASGLATAILVLDPEAIVLGGGLSDIAFLVPQLQQRLPHYLLNGVALPKISRAQFGATGGVRGAALLNYAQ